MSATSQPAAAADAAQAVDQAPAEPAAGAGLHAAARVKICGITNLGDAELAVELGAWAVGMNFYAPSPRRCSLEEIERHSEELGLSLVQLHGDEGPAFCGEARRRTGARVIKAAQVSGPGDVRDLERFHVDFHLLDARSRAIERRGMRGGTGETFDWGLVAARRSSVPLILSGGLGPENVAEAIAATHPYAVDSASGTESAPGHKDPKRLADFFRAVELARADPHEIGART